MNKLHLVIGNKNYSSWSLRPWMALAMAGIPFTETVILLDQPDTKAAIAAHSSAGRVPVLHDGTQTIWESLAILEYLAEGFPDKQLWPAARATRAVARSMANEMHAGFHALRSACPMNLRRPRRKLPLTDHVRADVARLEELWRAARRVHGEDGPFLFGHFTNVDAMYAPVVTRLDTYMVDVAADTRAYMDTVMATTAFRAWRDAALQEPWTVPSDEVD